MKKSRLLKGIAWSLVLVSVFSACSKSEKKQTSDDDESVVDTVETTTAPSKTVQPENFDYKESYRDLVENSSPYCTYNLIYFDDDTIPELVVDDGIGTVYMYTYKDGEVITILDESDYQIVNGMGSYYNYAPFSGLVNKPIMNEDGVFGFDYGSVTEDYEIAFDGIKRTTRPDEAASDLSWKYYINDKEVTEEEYIASTYPEYTIWLGIVGDYSFSEIKNYILWDRVPDYLSNSTYEIFVEDCTWEEAKLYCESKGGHLATPNGMQELRDVKSAISASDVHASVYYIGGACYEGGEFYWRADDNIAVGDYIWEDKDNIRTNKSQDRLCFMLSDPNDFNTIKAVAIPNDLFALDESYRGKIAFVCEYD